MQLFRISYAFCGLSIPSAWGFAPSVRFVSLVCFSSFSFLKRIQFQSLSLQFYWLYLLFLSFAFQFDFLSASAEKDMDTFSLHFFTPPLIRCVRRQLIFSSKFFSNSHRPHTFAFHEYLRALLSTVLDQQRALALVCDTFWMLWGILLKHVDMYREREHKREYLVCVSQIWVLSDDIVCAYFDNPVLINNLRRKLPLATKAMN